MCPFCSDSERRQSPFDISQIPEMFSGKLSPVTTAPPSTDRVLNLYSRHSRNNSQADLAQMADSSSSSSRKVSTDETSVGVADAPLTSTPSHDNSSVTFSAGDPNSDGQELTVSPKTRAKLQLDLLVHEHPPLKTSEADEVTKVIAMGDDQPSCDEDRFVEYENPGDTESSEPVTTETTTSSFPADDESEGMKYAHILLSTVCALVKHMCLLR